MRKKNTVTLLASKKGSEAIACVTAYDYTSAVILDDAGMDLVLVGDSLGMVMQGKDSTVSVTLDEMIYHSKLVRRGLNYAFMVTDMPFGTVNTVREGLANCVKIVKETGTDAVKIEGATDTVLEITRRATDMGINVVGHIGLMPQFVSTMGGYRIQGYDNCEELIAQAEALSDAGARFIVLEGIEAGCSKQITQAVAALTIGIGAGIHCDGQVLVYHDIFGLYHEMQPKFVKRYAEAGDLIKNAAEKYIEEVKNRAFPGQEHSYLRK